MLLEVQKFTRKKLKFKLEVKKSAIFDFLKISQQDSNFKKSLKYVNFPKLWKIALKQLQLILPTAKDIIKTLIDWWRRFVAIIKLKNDNVVSYILNSFVFFRKEFPRTIDLEWYNFPNIFAVFSYPPSTYFFFVISR